MRLPLKWQRADEGQGLSQHASATTWVCLDGSVLLTGRATSQLAKSRGEWKNEVKPGIKEEGGGLGDGREKTASSPSCVCISHQS